MTSSQENDKLMYHKIIQKIENLTYNKLKSIILEKFHLKNHIRIFNFYNREILDTSDLKYLELENENNKIIYFHFIKDYDYSLGEELQYNLVDKFIIKSFKIIKKIGEGGFGKVYLAEQIFNKKKYAIKTLKCKYSKQIILYILRIRNQVFL